MATNIKTNTNKDYAAGVCSTYVRADLPALLGADLIPVLVETAFVLSLVTIAIVMRMQRLTPVQFFWLVTILLGIFFAATMMFFLKYS
jgi:hypothetical protein